MVDTLKPHPKPLPGMSKRERDVWKGLVSAFPGGWFRPSDSFLLAETVRAFVTAEKLAGLIDTASQDELKQLLQLRDVESRRGAALMTKLRLPPQSRSDRHAAGTAAAKFGESRPWEVNDPNDRFFKRSN